MAGERSAKKEMICEAEGAGVNEEGKLYRRNMKRVIELQDLDRLNV